MSLSLQLRRRSASREVRRESWRAIGCGAIVYDLMSVFSRGVRVQSEGCRDERRGKEERGNWRHVDESRRASNTWR